MRHYFSNLSNPLSGFNPSIGPPPRYAAPANFHIFFPFPVRPGALPLGQIQQMKITLAFLALFLGLFQHVQAQNPVNWTNDELLEPASLAKTLAVGKDLPVIYSVGPGALIPHSIAIGMTTEAENLATLKQALAGLPRDTAVVIYCGCCPFAHCPNVRPAIAALKELKFTHFKLLNLPQNIKADWIDKGYPTAK